MIYLKILKGLPKGSVSNKQKDAPKDDVKTDMEALDYELMVSTLEGPS